MARVFRFLFAPGDVARHAVRDGRGISTLLVLLALEVIIAQPRVWVGALMRLRGAPVVALGLLNNTYLHWTLPVVVAVFCLGLLRHYLGRLRGWRHLDFLGAANAFAYAYLPHTLFLCAGALLAWCGATTPWLPQAALGSLDVGWSRWLKLGYVFLPSALYVVAVWRALREPTAEHSSTLGLAETEPLRVVVARPAGALTAALFVVGIVSTLAQVALHWADYRPKALGEPMPAFFVKGLGRADLQSSETLGMPIVIDFWATWCPPCIAALPHLEELYRAYADRGVRFMAVNIEPDNLAGVESFVRAKRFTLPVYLDADGSMQEHFHVHMYPTTWLVDRDGRIEKIHNGSVAPAELRAEIDAMLQP